MKRIILLCVAIFSVLSLNSLKAQNFQFYYDLGSSMQNLYGKEYQTLKNRPIATATMEDFIIDKWGSSYYFVDFSWLGGQSVSALWELTRSFNLKDNWGLQLTWDGGLAFIDKKPFHSGDFLPGIYLGDAVMFGPSYTFSSSDFSKFLTLTAYYRVNYANEVNKWANYELKAVWDLQFADGKFNTQGFLSWFSDYRYKNGSKDKEFATRLVTHPQFWCNLNKFESISNDFRLSIGTEIRITQNIEEFDKFLVVPAIGLKWTFR